jgi:hypothetical protein
MHGDSHRGVSSFKGPEKIKRGSSMNMTKGRLKKKNDGIAATMKRQPLLSACLDAMEEWKRRTSYKACDVSVDSALLDANAVVWIDKLLFIDALADLLESSARSSIKNNNIKLTVATSGMNSFRILIDYTPSPEQGIETHSPWANSRFSAMTQQIISQHGGCLEFSETLNSSRIMIRIS